MCGIAGKLWFDAARPGDREGVAALVAALQHRGPDDEGLIVDGPVALGHRRLTIVDLSERGRQPMSSEDGSCWLVCNGEIYNHQALRAELRGAGHRFKSDSDNEVILPLYRQWWAREGADFVSRLEGMYAFALWDGRARRLLLGRDRVGKKPLVYSQTAEGLVFASELGALARDPLVDRSLDWAALSDFLAYKVVPHPATAYVGARKLPAGNLMTVELGAAGAAPLVSIHRTWRLAPGSDETLPSDLDAAAAEVRERFRAAVRRRLMADVPLGAFLSGGLDSAAVVAAMAEAGGTVRTFTIGFKESEWDETLEARRVARHFGTEHHEALVEADALALLGRLQAQHGEPFADASAIPTFMVSELAARHVKVVLTGDGGDERFAGYDRYRALALAEALQGPAAAPLRWGLAAAAAGAVAVGAAPVQGVLSGGGRGAGERLLRFADALGRSPRQRNHDWRVGGGRLVLDLLLTDEGRRLLPQPSFYGADVDRPLRLNEALALDVERYLPDDVLMKLDLASMAVGLEARAPFLDRELMEYAAALPGRFKLGRPGPGGEPRPARLARATSKLVLRRALAPLLPADLAGGPKRGFGVPLDSWFRGPLLEPARAVLLSPRARQRGLFRPEAVEALLEAHANSEVAAHEPLLTLLALEQWFQGQESR